MTLMATETKPCTCSDDATTVTAGVAIKGHNDGCPHAAPRRYVWLACGELRIGTLADYARAVSYADMAGDSEAISTELRTWNETFTASFSGGHRFDESGYAARTITVGNESAVYVIDGRS